MKDQNTKALLTDHYRKYPCLGIEDVFKFLFQSSFGCEHLVSSEETALAYIRAELDAVTEVQARQVDPLDGNYSRVHLSCIGKDITPELLAKYFCLSAKAEPRGKEALEKKLSVARELIKDGTLPLSLTEFDTKLSAWREAGYPAIHHSDTFRKAYAPHYRVIANEYLNFL